MTTFVLLHGGGMGGWAWKFVRELLEAKGHKVYTPTFTGFGEREHLIGRDIGHAVHAKDIINTLKYEELNDVVIVAHSYSGTVVPGVLADQDAAGRVRRVIYLDAITAYEGERIASLMGYASEEEVAGLDAMLDKGEGPVGSGVHEMVRGMAKEHPAMMDPQREQWMLAQLSDQPMRATSCVIPVGADSIKVPVDYVAAKFTVMEKMHQRARDMGWTVHEHPGDHSLHVGDPEGVAAMILKITGDA